MATEFSSSRDERAELRSRAGSRSVHPTQEDLQLIALTRAARELLSAKWKVDVLYLLARGVRRYSRLYDHLMGASKKMLTDSLRGLERDGLVRRTVYAEVPARVEYSLTPLGWSATELLMVLADWATDHWPEVEAARTGYAEVHAASNQEDVTAIPLQSAA
jgi:DNA-binding HxlR family transcriptional regulator